MRIASILLIFFVILCTGCTDNEPPKKDIVEKPAAQQSGTKLEIETPIYTSLLEISRDVKHGNADKWKDKWIVFEGLVKEKEGQQLILQRPLSGGHIGIIGNVHGYDQGQYTVFSARVIDLSLQADFVGVTLILEDKGKIVIPPDYTDVIDVDLNVLVNDIKQGGRERWIGKKVRFIGKVDYKSEEADELHIVNPDFDIFNIFEFGNFEFIISGFDPNGNQIGKYENNKVYTFTVKIESLDSNLLILLHRYRLITSIIEE